MSYAVAAYASVAMVAQDILGALLTQAEARDKAVLAGWLDSAGWLVAIATTSWAVTALQGHNTGLKIAVLGAVTVANFGGSWLGTKMGKRFLKVEAPHGRARKAPRLRRLSGPRTDHRQLPPP